MLKKSIKFYFVNVIKNVSSSTYLKKNRPYVRPSSLILAKFFYYIHLSTDIDKKKFYE